MTPTVTFRSTHIVKDFQRATPTRKDAACTLVGNTLAPTTVGRFGYNIVPDLYAAPPRKGQPADSTIEVHDGKTSAFRYPNVQEFLETFKKNFDSLR